MQRDNHRRSRTAAIVFVAVVVGLVLGVAAVAVAAPLPAELLPATLVRAASPVSPAAAQVVVDPVPIPVQGANRYLTALEAAKKFGPATTVVVATGESFPDALGGAALAGAVKGPILLTRKDAVPAEVLSYIDGLNPTKIYVLGSTSAVSSAAAGQLAAIAPVTRLGGANRYETAAKVAAETIRLLSGSYTGKAFLATGANFPDALAAAPVMYAKGMPLVLANPTGGFSLPAGVTKVKVLGSASAVPASSVAALGAKYDGRIEGANRYATAKKIAEYGVSLGLAWDNVGIATGENFPDALCAGPLVGSKGSVVLLTTTASLSADAASALSAHKADVDQYYLFGGIPALSATTRTQVATALRRVIEDEEPTFTDLHALPDVFCADSGCHDSDLASIHLDARLESGKLIACSACHGPGVTPARECDTCHAPDAVHVSLHEPAVVPEGCAGEGCHAGANLLPIHANSTCETCHASTDADVIAAIEAGDLSCAACHGENAGDHGPLHDSDLSQGCSSCHDANLVVEHEALGCAACHASSDPAVTGAVAAGDLSCAACHGENAGNHGPLHDSALAAGCTGCHDANLVVEHEPLTCATCHESADPAVKAAIAAGNLDCAACHGDGAGIHGPLHDSTLTADCAGCHEANLVTEHAGIDCAACHASSDPAVVAAVAAGDLACTACHGPDAGNHAALHDSGLSAGCTGCHDANLVTEHDPLRCATCHESTDADVIAAIAAGKLDCAGCHGDSAGIHGPLHASALSPDCAACHEANLIDEHDGYSCGDCHASIDPNVVAAIAAGDLDCVACHPTVSHEPVHGPATIPADCSGAGCHAGTNLVPIHANSTCSTCHASADPNVTGAIAAGNLNCSACHPAVDHVAIHQPVTVPVGCSGAGCHAGTNLVPIHANSTCATCHASTDAAVVAAIAAGDFACTSCHGADAGKHLLLHDVEIGGCADCHVDNLVNEHEPRTVLCEGCHESTDPLVQTAIATGQKTCTACHDLAEHPYPAEAHTANTQSTLGFIALWDGQAGPYTHEGAISRTGTWEYCTSCHSSDLAVLHAADGCATCHPTPRDTFTSWNGSCQQGGCHATIHDDAKAIHNDPALENNCNNCHFGVDFEVSCYDAGCHP